MMSKLTDITLEDIIVKRRIPSVDMGNTVATLLKQITRHRVTIAIIEKNGEVIGTTHVKNMSKFIVDNIWDLNTVINRFSIGDVEIIDGNTPIFKASTPVLDAINYVVNNKTSLAVELDEEYHEVSPEDLISLYLLWEDEFNNTLIKTYTNKNYVKVPPNQSVVSTYNKYSEKGLDAAIITNVMNYPIGIATNTDYVYSYEELGRKSLEIRPDRDIKLTVDIVMSSPVIFEFEDNPAGNALAKMVENDIGHLPVVDDKEEVIGMIYKYDILKEMVRKDENS